MLVGSSARAIADSSQNSPSDHFGCTLVPAVSVIEISGLRPVILKRSGLTLLVIGTSSSFVLSMAASLKRSSWVLFAAGASWQRAHFISTPRKAAETMVPLAAIGTSFWEAVANPAGPPKRSLPFMRQSSVTKTSIGLLSRSAS